tara:strand:+ start:1279 stop:2016 length:738 start_codon:yes stop_codon:yes gene_type:complete
MTLPSSGSLSYNSIRAEFGSPSSNVYLSLYYRGGPYTYNLPQNANITTGSSSTISVNNFYGSAGKGPFAFFNGGIYTSGGKAPLTYYGAGGPSLPSMSDSSLTIGGTGYTVNRYFAMGNSQFYMTGTPASNVTSQPTWSVRNFYGYNPSGSLVHNFRTGSGAGRGPLVTPLSVTVQQPRTTAPIPSGSSWVYEANNQYPGGTGLYFQSDQVASNSGNNPPGGSTSPQYITGNGSTLNQSLIIKAN